ncbi:MAG TPA: dephospho-CoA kinase [Polyangia bacterium]|jgi:dephospho-CoA kinase
MAGLRLIGLTGGIGTGKSAVGRILARRGFPVIDADELARVVVTPGRPALEEIRALWPAVVGPEGLDRKRLGAIVFADTAARVRLEAILHPRIVALSNERAEALARAGHRLAFYEASLLVETQRHQTLDGLIVVDSPEEARVARVMARDGATADAVRARMAAQLPMSDKRRVATAVIDNDGDMAALEAKVDALLARLAPDTAPA